MKMSEVKVGMILRNPNSGAMPMMQVTEITENGFKYKHSPFSVKTADGFGETTGGEHYGIDGQSLYFTFQPEPTAQNIQQLDLATGASTTLYSESCLQAPCFTGMAAIGGTVYWADNTGIFELK